MLPNLKHAKLSANALSESLKIKPNAAREYLAQALEYETWDRYVEAINKNKPEEIDANLSPDIANHRLGLFAQNLEDIFDIHQVVASNLAATINPFSGGKPKPYRIDIEDDEDDSDSLNMHDLFEMGGGEEGMLDFIHKMAEDVPELESLKHITDVKDFQNKLRISHPIEPADYYNALANVTTWNIDDTFYEEDYSYLDASFHLVSPFDDVSYPVYLVSLCASPGDTNDKVFEQIKEVIGNYKGRGLILFKGPIFKKLNDDTFVVIGTFFNGKSWSWTLLTDDDPETQSKEILADNYDLESPIPNSKFSVKERDNFPNHVVYQFIAQGGGDQTTDTIKIPNEFVTVGGVGGWSSMLF